MYLSIVIFVFICTKIKKPTMERKKPSDYSQTAKYICIFWIISLTKFIVSIFNF
jgi:hypothetical protein